MQTEGFNIYDVEGAIHIARSIISFVRVATICNDRAISFCRVGLTRRLSVIEAMFIAVQYIATMYASMHIFTPINMSEDP